MDDNALAAVTFRRGRPNDAASIVRVARDCWHAAYDDILGRDTVESTVDEWYDVEDLARATQTTDHVVEVAEGDRILAFAHAGPGTETDGALLYRLYADPNWWGTGIGSRLVDRTLDRLWDRWDRVRAMVIADNTIGVSFYQSYGWIHVETRETEIADVTVAEHIYEIESGHPTD